MTSVTSDAENDFISNLAGSGGFWIGGHKLGGSCHNNCWVWSDRNITLAYVNWDVGRGEPNNENDQMEKPKEDYRTDELKSCIEMLQSSQWNARPCEAHKNFVCKKPIPGGGTAGPGGRYIQYSNWRL